MRDFWTLAAIATLATICGTIAGLSLDALIHLCD